MPVVTIDIPKINKTQKEDIVKSITENISKIAELPPETIIVLIKEIDYEDIGVGGNLLSNLPSDKWS